MQITPLPSQKINWFLSWPSDEPNFIQRAKVIDIELYESDKTVPFWNASVRHSPHQLVPLAHAMRPIICFSIIMPTESVLFDQYLHFFPSSPSKSAAGHFTPTSAPRSCRRPSFENMYNQPHIVYLHLDAVQVHPLGCHKSSLKT